MTACRRGHLDVVKVLLANNANVDKFDIIGNTALHYACILNYLQIVEVLLKAKANPFLKNTKGQTPLDVTSKKNNKIKLCIRNNPWYRRRSFILMRPHKDHTTNKKHRMTPLAWILTAKEKGDGEDVELFCLRREVALFI